MYGNFRTKDEKLRYYQDFNRSIEYEKNGIKEEIIKEARGELTGVKRPAALLLDSSLISETKNKKYNAKVVHCGCTTQVYLYENVKLKKDKNLEKVKNVDVDYLFKKKNIKKKNDLKVIEYKNIMRSKFELQRLVKANESSFRTFITLTFKENQINIEQANKKFHSFIVYLKRLKSDFCYVCVPEFQKRGAVHYHLLTNIDYTDYLLISQNELKIWKPKKKNWEIFKTVNNWKHGFSSVIAIENINVVAYMSKYMTKDIDNRLWGKRRYLYSMNLNRPVETFIDLSDSKELLFFLKQLNDTEMVYNHSYVDRFGETVDFYEYKKNE